MKPCIFLGPPCARSQDSRARVLHCTQPSLWSPSQSATGGLAASAFNKVSRLAQLSHSAEAHGDPAVNLKELVHLLQSCVPSLVCKGLRGVPGAVIASPTGEVLAVLQADGSVHAAQCLGFVSKPGCCAACRVWKQEHLPSFLPTLRLRRGSHSGAPTLACLPLHLLTPLPKAAALKRVCGVSPAVYLLCRRGPWPRYDT
mmetsp:Transcript_26045/g.60045  ORF Transcript_26045/g.60045 Transcript_26045/m.60045 type:complete len:200 (+) Transcript_26045:773-1372(+)